MNYKDRIMQMQQDGKITQQQAASMLASLDDSNNTVPTDVVTRKELPLKLSLMLGSALLLGIFFFSGGDAPPDTIQNVNETLNQIGEIGKMSKNITSTLSIFVIMLPLIASVIGFVYIYNKLVAQEESVLGAWAQVESNFQRRTDLIPGLVKTVSTFMEHEKELMQDVTESRTRQDVQDLLQKLEKTRQDADTLTETATEKLSDEAHMQSVLRAQEAVGDNIRGIFGLVENYPQLRSADNFLTLQDQLEGTENRINVARMAFNDAVREYNADIRKMPASWVASIGNFQRKAYFETDKKNETVQPLAFE